MPKLLTEVAGRLVLRSALGGLRLIGWPWRVAARLRVSRQEYAAAMRQHRANTEYLRQVFGQHPGARDPNADL
jgi:hypothetical protein